MFQQRYMMLLLLLLGLVLSCLAEAAAPAVGSQPSAEFLHNDDLSLLARRHSSTLEESDDDGDSSGYSPFTTVAASLPTTRTTTTTTSVVHTNQHGLIVALVEVEVPQKVSSRPSAPTKNYDDDNNSINAASWQQSSIAADRFQWIVTVEAVAVAPPPSTTTSISRQPHDKERNGDTTTTTATTEGNRDSSATSDEIYKKEVPAQQFSQQIFLQWNGTTTTTTTATSASTYPILATASCSFVIPLEPPLRDGDDDPIIRDGGFKSPYYASLGDNTNNHHHHDLSKHHESNTYIVSLWRQEKGTAVDEQLLTRRLATLPRRVHPRQTIDPVTKVILSYTMLLPMDGADFPSNDRSRSSYEEGISMPSSLLWKCLAALCLVMYCYCIRLYRSYKTQQQQQSNRIVGEVSDARGTSVGQQHNHHSADGAAAAAAATNVRNDPTVADGTEQEETMMVGQFYRDKEEEIEEEEDRLDHHPRNSNIVHELVQHNNDPEGLFSQQMDDGEEEEMSLCGGHQRPAKVQQVPVHEDQQALGDEFLDTDLRDTNESGHALEDNQNLERVGLDTIGDEGRPETALEGYTEHSEQDIEYQESDEDSGMINEDEPTTTRIDGETDRTVRPPRFDDGATDEEGQILEDAKKMEDDNEDESCPSFGGQTNELQNPVTGENDVEISSSQESCTKVECSHKTTEKSEKQTEEGEFEGGYDDLEPIEEEAKPSGREPNPAARPDQCDKTDHTEPSEPHDEDGFSDNESTHLEDSLAPCETAGAKAKQRLLEQNISLPNDCGPFSSNPTETCSPIRMEKDKGNSRLSLDNNAEGIEENLQSVSAQDVDDIALTFNNDATLGTGNHNDCHSYPFRRGSEILTQFSFETGRDLSQTQHQESSCGKSSEPSKDAGQDEDSDELNESADLDEKESTRSCSPKKHQSMALEQAAKETEDAITGGDDSYVSTLPPSSDYQSEDDRTTHPTTDEAADEDSNSSPILSQKQQSPGICRNEKDDDTGESHASVASPATSPHNSESPVGPRKSRYFQDREIIEVDLTADDSPEDFSPLLKTGEKRPYRQSSIVADHVPSNSLQTTSRPFTKDKVWNISRVSKSSRPSIPKTIALPARKKARTK